MSNEIIIKLPKLGESILEATVVEILKNEGDFIEKDESILEVSTDKINSEIPSTDRGIIKKVLVKKDEVIKVGQDLVVIQKMENKDKIDIKESQKKIEYSPVVLRLAKEHNISNEQLDDLSRQNSSKRVSKQDLEEYINQTKDGNKNLSVKKEKTSFIRKKIASNLSKSFYSAPHAYLMDEIDVTNILNKIKKEKENYLKTKKVKLSITTFIARAIAIAAKEFGYMNSEWQEDYILLKQDVNLGIAVDTDDGLQVVVIKKCNEKTFDKIAEDIFNLAIKARSSNLDIADIENGTITLSNFGVTGISAGFPIIRNSEACIIGLGAIKNKLEMIDNKIQNRFIVNLVVSFDHRIVDGIYVCNFINKIKQLLENNEV